jgi:hydrogenase expression/formation protein HypC
MCIGIPMQVKRLHGTMAVCQYQEQTRLIDMMLVGEQAIGTWILVFLDTAREVLTTETALQIANALEALQLTVQGETGIDHLFADLINREPELPAFLKT